MAVVEPIDAPVSLLGKTSGELTLRVCRGGRAQQIVRLAEQKCSVGSGADCTLRLHAAGIEPHHFVILRGQRHTIVRRLAGEALLNNQPFEDAPLASGDWLTLGDLQVQVLTPDGVPAGRNAATAWDEREALPSSQRPGEAAELSELRDRVALANGQGRQRVRRIIVRLRKLQRRFKNLELRRQQQASETLELEERLAVWNTERAQFDECRADFDRDQRTFIASRATALAESLEREQQLAARELALASQTDQIRRDAATLAAERTILHAQHDQHHADHQLRVAALEDRTCALADQTAALETAHQQHAQSRLQSESERREAEARLAQQEAELAARLHEAESQRSALDAREQQLQAAADSLRTSQRQLDEHRLRWEAESSAEQARLDRAAREMNDKLSALEARWREAADLTRDLTARQAAISTDEQQLRQAQADWAAELSNSKIDSHAQLQQLAEQQAALARERHDAERHSAEIDLQRDSLQQEAAELESLRQAFAAEREHWEAERTATLARLALRTEEVDRLSQELDERTRQSAAELQTSAAQQANDAAHAAAAAELAARTAELDRDREAFAQAQAAELESLHEAFAAEREHWEAERTATLARLALRTEEVDRLSQELDERTRQSAADLQTSAAQQANEATHAAVAAELATRTAELDRDREAFAQAQAAWEAQLAAAPQPHAEDLHQASEDAARLAAESAQLTEARRAWQAEQADEQARLQAAQNELAAGRARLEQACADLEAAHQAFERDRQAEMAAASDSATSREQEQLAANQATYEARQNELDAARCALEADRLNLETDRQRWADKRRSSDEQSTADRARIEQLQAALDAECSQREQLAERLEQQADLVAQRQQYESERGASEAEQNRLAAELAAGRDALAAEQAAFQTEQEQARVELAALTVRQAEQTAEIERFQNELVEERQAFRDRREQIELKLEARTEDLAARWTELETRQVEFDAWQASQEAELAQRREAVGRESDERQDTLTVADEPSAETTPPADESPGRSTPLSSLALLTKMGLSVPNDDEPDQAVAAEAAVSQPPAHKPHPAGAAPGSGATEEDDAAYMDAYMARLLSQSGSRTAAACAQRTSSAPQVQATPRAPEPSQAAAPGTEAKRPERSLAPRALPPELSADLSAMREVANANARSAIKTHMNSTVSKQRVKQMRACLIMLVICGALIWRHFEGLPWMLEAAGVVGLLSVFMGSRQLYSMHTFRRVQAELDAQRASPASPGQSPRCEADASIPSTESVTTELPSPEADSSGEAADAS